MTHPTALEIQLARAIDALAAVPLTVELYRELDDASLLELARLSAREQQLSAMHASVVSGELARRSAPELGSSGLAQRLGHRTPAKLVQATTGSSAKDAAAAVRVGLVLNEQSPVADPTTGEVCSPSEPWMAPVADAVLSGAVSPAAADAIRSGLGTPPEGSADAFTAAATELCDAASTLDADRLFRLARELRDALDAAGITDRERQRQERRSLRLNTMPDGSVRAVWVLTGEAASVVTDLFDRATSPRRGGPRFVDESRSRRAASIVGDERTTEQIASDVFVELLRQGADADDTQLLGSGAPVVTVLVSQQALESRSGHGFIGSQPDPISMDTVERLACAGHVDSLHLDGVGQPFDEEREQRFYTARQRKALAARDGGCRFPDCDRPPSWTDAHHIQFWARDRGRTNIADGILLCRHHHLLLHNNHWEIERRETEYFLIPPPDFEFGSEPIPMPSKSRAWRELQAS